MGPLRRLFSIGWVRCATLATTVLVASSGCTRNYYYGAVPPGCVPAAMGPAVQVGSICDTTPAGNPVIIQGSKPKGVVSQSGSGWKRADPEIDSVRF